jgi:hypothetical protein
MLVGCTRGGGENFGLGGDAPVPVDVKRLAEPDQLLRALSLPGAQLDQQLGAHRLTAGSRTQIEPPGRPVEQLDESYRLDSDGKGALHVVHDNSRGYGLEAVLLAGQLYVKPRYGRFAIHRPEGDEVARLRDNVEGVAFGYLEVLRRWLVVKEVGRSEAFGRPAVRVALSASASPSKMPSERAAYRKWRDTVEVRSINGELLLDAASGAPLAGRLVASYTFSRSDLKGPVAVTLDYKMETRPPEPIVAPADAVVARRSRPMVDRDALLEGLQSVKR